MKISWRARKDEKSLSANCHPKSPSAEKTACPAKERLTWLAGLGVDLPPLLWPRYGFLGSEDAYLPYLVFVSLEKMERRVGFLEGKAVSGIKEQVPEREASCKLLKS